MDFRLTEEQKMLRNEARAFAKRELLGENNSPPTWLRLRKKEFPWDIHQKMVEAGYAGATLPQEYGGTGLDDVSFVIMVEELCRAEAGAGLSTGASLSLAAQPILLAGTNEQKETWLPKIAAGAIGAYAQTEPNAGSDVAGIQTRGVIDGDSLVITGAKQFITNGSIADVIVAIIRTEKTDKPHKNLTAVIIDAKKALRDGTLIIEKDFDKMGLHCSPTSNLIFQNCRVPLSNIIGPPGMGWLIAMGTLIGSRPMIAAQGVGLAQAALDCAIKHVITREQFGKKLAEHQAVQHELAEMELMIEEARLLTYQAAWAVATTPVLERENIMEKASFAKLHASRVASNVAMRSLRLHGGMGYMSESRISAILQDSIVLEIYEGASMIQLNIIGRHLLKKHGLKISH